MKFLCESPLRAMLLLAGGLATNCKVDDERQLLFSKHRMCMQHAGISSSIMTLKRPLFAIHSVLFRKVD